MSMQTILTIVIIAVIAVLVIYGVIITAVLVVKIKTIDRYDNLYLDMKLELENKREIITKQNEFLEEVKNAKTLKEHIAIQKKLNNWSTQ